MSYSTGIAHLALSSFCVVSKWTDFRHRFSQIKLMLSEKGVPVAGFCRRLLIGVSTGFDPMRCWCYISITVVHNPTRWEIFRLHPTSRTLMGATGIQPFRHAVLVHAGGPAAYHALLKYRAKARTLIRWNYHTRASRLHSRKSNVLLLLANVAYLFWSHGWLASMAYAFLL